MLRLSTAICIIFITTTHVVAHKGCVDMKSSDILKQVTEKRDKLDSRIKSQENEQKDQMESRGAYQLELNKLIRIKEREENNLEEARESLVTAIEEVKHKEGSVEEAERRLREARENESRNSMIGAVGTAALAVGVGYFTFGLGYVALAAAGAGGGIIGGLTVSQVQEEERNARHRLNAARHEEFNARDLVRRLENSMEVSEEKIKELKDKVSRLDKKIQDRHQELETLKKEHAALSKAHEHWSKTTNTAESHEHMKKELKRVEEKFLAKGGTELMESSTAVKKQRVAVQKTKKRLVEEVETGCEMHWWPL